MKPKYLCIFCVIFCGSSFEIAAKGATCKFSYIDRYTCSIKSFDLSGNDAQNIILGAHEAHKSDDVVATVYCDNCTAPVPIFDINFCQKFKKLETIKLNNLKIKQIDQKTFKNCQNLTYFDLDENNIGEISENLLSQLQNVYYLSFWKNQISSINENAFMNQKELRELDLGNNQLSSLPPKVFEPLLNLDKLSLGNNQLTIIHSDSFGIHKTLKSINFSYNNINAIDERLINNAPIANLRIIENICCGSWSIYGYENLHQCLDNYQSYIVTTTTSNTARMTMRSITKVKISTTTSIKSTTSASVKQKTTARTSAEKLISSSTARTVKTSTTPRVTKKSTTKLETSTTTAVKSTTSSSVKQKTTAWAPTSSFIAATTTDNAITCGRSKATQGNIVGGTFAAKGDFPWMAALFKDGWFFCSGTLVSEKKVVSAAHCMHLKHNKTGLYPRDVTVILGMHDLNNHVEIGRRNLAVWDIHVHPRWNPKIESYDVDVSVLVLEIKVTFDAYIQPICLIEPGSIVESITSGFVIGYGKSEDTTKEHETVPKILDVPIHDTLDCVLKFHDLVRLASRNTFCGGHANGTGVCDGDSGSGMIVRHEGTYYLRGIVSSSLRNSNLQCDVYSYSVYTNILKYREWIDSIDVVGDYLTKK